MVYKIEKVLKMRGEDTAIELKSPLRREMKTKRPILPKTAHTQSGPHCPKRPIMPKAAQTAQSNPHCPKWPILPTLPKATHQAQTNLSRPNVIHLA